MITSKNVFMLRNFLNIYILLLIEQKISKDRSIKINKIRHPTLSCPIFLQSIGRNQLEKSASVDSMRSDTTEERFVSVESNESLPRIENEAGVDDDGLRRASWTHSKPDLPKRLVAMYGNSAFRNVFTV